LIFEKKTSRFIHSGSQKNIKKVRTSLIPLFTSEKLELYISKLGNSFDENFFSTSILLNNKKSETIWGMRFNSKESLTVFQQLLVFKSIAVMPLAT